MLAITDATVLEGNSIRAAAFVVSLSATSNQPVTVNYTTANGTAIADNDYVETSGTLTFNPGETLKTIVVPILGDTVWESNESFLINLSDATNALIGDDRGLGLIYDDDNSVIS